MSIKKSFGLLAITGLLLSTEATWAWGSRSANQTNVLDNTSGVRAASAGDLRHSEIVNSDTDRREIYSTNTSVDRYSSDTNGVVRVSNLQQNSDRNSIATTQNPPEFEVERLQSNSRKLAPATTVLTQQQDIFSSDIAGLGVSIAQRSSDSTELPQASIVIPVPPPLTQTIPRSVAKTRKAPNVIVVKTIQSSPTILPIDSTIEKTPEKAPPKTADGQIAIYPLLKPAPITSRFGWRTHPLTGVRRFHAGIDIGAPTGTPVVATVSGTIVSAGWNGGYGKAVVIEHSNGARHTLYGHLSQISVQAGQSIEQGTVLGLVGSTGQSTGPHLHFEERVPNGDEWVAIDPAEEIKYALDVLKRADPYARKNLPAGI
jgi:murein DD-endopeptidase MepM/ murein hydrolase activator NlpD